MTNVIIIQGDELEQFYERTLQYLNEKYHTYPDVLPEIPMSEQQAAEMNAFGYLAAQMSGSGSGNSAYDRFQWNRDPRYSNGLHRRRLR